MTHPALVAGNTNDGRLQVFATTKTGGFIQTGNKRRAENGNPAGVDWATWKDWPSIAKDGRQKLPTQWLFAERSSTSSMLTKSQPYLQQVSRERGGTELSGDYGEAKLPKVDGFDVRRSGLAINNLRAQHDFNIPGLG